MRNILAQSKNYKLFGAYEEAQVEGEGITGHVVVGDFYGSADCGCIDFAERWCVSGGNGIVIYQLSPPFEEYKFDHDSSQWKDLWRSEEDWYPEIIYQIEKDIVRIVVDVFSKAKGVYDLNVKTLELIKRV
jgi:hypothetical protein